MRGSIRVAKSRYNGRRDEAEKYDQSDAPSHAYLMYCLSIRQVDFQAGERLARGGVVDPNMSFDVEIGYKEADS